jgi:hypothetical protein
MLFKLNRKKSLEEELQQSMHNLDALVKEIHLPLIAADLIER